MRIIPQSCLVTSSFSTFILSLTVWGTTIKWKNPRCNFRWSQYFFRKIFAVHWPKTSAQQIFPETRSFRQKNGSWEACFFWTLRAIGGASRNFRTSHLGEGVQQIHIMSNMVLWCRPSLCKPSPLKKNTCSAAFVLFLSFCWSKAKPHRSHNKVRKLQRWGSSPNHGW